MNLQIIFGTAAAILVAVIAELFNLLERSAQKDSEAGQGKAPSFEFHVTATNSLIAFAVMYYMVPFVLEQRHPVYTAYFLFYLIFAAIMDSQTLSVYSIWHIPAIAASCGIIIWDILHGALGKQVFIPLAIFLFFTILQGVLQSFGFADVYAVAACGLYLCTIQTQRFDLYELLVYFLAATVTLFWLANITNIQLHPFKFKRKEPYIPAILLSVLLLSI